MVWIKEWSFFGPKNLDLTPKIRFCYRTPDFVTLSEMVDLAPSDRFFYFLFPKNRRFRKKNRPTRQKVFPHPTVRHRLPVPALARGLEKKKWRSFNSRSRSAVFLLSSCNRCRSSVTALRSWTNSFHFISTNIWQEYLCIFYSREYFSVGTQF